MRLATLCRLVSGQWCDRNHIVAACSWPLRSLWITQCLLGEKEDVSIPSRHILNQTYCVKMLHRKVWWKTLCFVLFTNYSLNLYYEYVPVKQSISRFSVEKSLYGLHLSYLVDLTLCDFSLFVKIKNTHWKVYIKSTHSFWWHQEQYDCSYKTLERWTTLALGVASQRDYFKGDHGNI